MIKPAVLVKVRDRVAEILAEREPVQGPAPIPCTCGAPFWEHTGAAFTGSCARTGCTRYKINRIEEIAWSAIEADGRKVIADIGSWEWVKRQRKVAKRGPREPGAWSIGASDLSSCPRAIYYREVKPEGLITTWEDKREARIGGAIHDAIEAARRGLYPWREFEVSLVIDGLDSTHRLDEYDPITCVLTEYKSAGRATWDYVGQHGPRLGALKQAHTYAMQLIADGKPVRLIRIVYINRENGHEEPFEYEPDPVMAEAAISTLIGYATVLDAGGILPRDEERTGPSNDPICARCRFRITCWDIPRAQAAGRSPESWTVLGSEPEDETIIWALASYDAARSDETAGKRAKEQAKTLLEGIEHGTYGDWILGETPSNRVDQGGYIRKLEENYDLPEDMRPRLEQITIPRTSGASIKVAKVRAAKTQAAARKAKAETQDDVA